MPRKFNPLAEYGHVTPPHNGAVYYQDGAYFNPGGECVFEDRPATPLKKVKHVQTVIDGETHELSETETEEEVDSLPPADPKIQLTAWLKGEAPDLKFPTVRGLVKKAFGEVPETKEDIINFLVKQNLVPTELVKVS